MSDLYPVAGAKIYIGGVLATDIDDFVAADFTSQSWKEIDGWETMGEIGDAAEIITTQIINRNRDIKMKGTRSAGSMDNRFAIMPTDAGQIALIAAEKSTSNYAFKIEFDDQITPTTGTKTTLYFVGLVTSAREVGGGANTVRMLQGTVEINSNIVTVGAT